MLLLLAAVYQAFAGKKPREGDWTALAQYVLLIAALSAFCVLIPEMP